MVPVKRYTQGYTADFKLPFIFEQQYLNILHSVADVVSPRTKNKLDNTVSGS